MDFQWGHDFFKTRYNPEKRTQQLTKIKMNSLYMLG